MTDHKHPHHGKHGKSKSKGIHRDWRLWTVVILMLVGMAVYILSFDESLSPFRGGGVEEEVPAASE